MNNLMKVFVLCAAKHKAANCEHSFVPFYAIFIEVMHVQTKMLRYTYKRTSTSTKQFGCMYKRLLNDLYSLQYIPTCNIGVL